MDRAQLIIPADTDVSQPIVLDWDLRQVGYLAVGGGIALLVLFNFYRIALVPAIVVAAVSVLVSSALAFIEVHEQGLLTWIRMVLTYMRSQRRFVWRIDGEDEDQGARMVVVGERVRRRS